jgi:hypothetical protein
MLLHIDDVRKGFSIFGNKGAVWGDECHLMADGFNPTTLCGVPMLSTNWAQISKVETIGCEACIHAYLQAIKAIDKAEQECAKPIPTKFKTPKGWGKV